MRRARATALDIGAFEHTTSGPGIGPYGADGGVTAAPDAGGGADATVTGGGDASVTGGDGGATSSSSSSSSSGGSGTGDDGGGTTSAGGGLEGGTDGAPASGASPSSSGGCGCKVTRERGEGGDRWGFYGAIGLVLGARFASGAHARREHEGGGHGREC